MRLPVAGTRSPRPDVVFTRARVAVFVDGCFWGTDALSTARCLAPTESTGSQSSVANVERDRRNDAALAVAGRTVLRIAIPVFDGWSRGSPSSASLGSTDHLLPKHRKW